MTLTRQNVAPARKTHVKENLSAKGGYVLSPATKPEKVVLIATGSEVELALAAQAKLEAEGVGARVVSLPCFELFADQSAAYRKEVLGGDLPKVAVEAGVRDGWGPLDWPRGRLRRHALLRRVGTLQGAFQALRHHHRGCR